MKLDQLSIEQLKLIHELHNSEIDCDCSDCREYRRLIEEEN
jgi:hypothetical protein